MKPSKGNLIKGIALGIIAIVISVFITAEIVFAQTSQISASMGNEVKY